MLIKEYRIPLPLTVEEYRIAQLYMIAKKSRDESKGHGSGVEIIVNEPYQNGPGGKGGQYTRKIYHVGSHLPGWIKSLLPKSALTVEEEAWNAYPYTKTRYTCPFVEKFSLEIETYYFGDNGFQDNVFKLSGSDLSNRIVDVIDIVKDQLTGADYVVEEDPTRFMSEKTGRGPLDEEWLVEYWNEVRGKTQPTAKNMSLMCAYKLCRVEFRYWGMQTKLEKFIHDTALRKTMVRAHRQAWAWQDEWHGLTMDDIREIERQTQVALQKKMGKEDGSSTNDDGEFDCVQINRSSDIDICADTLSLTEQSDSTSRQSNQFISIEKTEENSTPQIIKRPQVNTISPSADVSSDEDDDDVENQQVVVAAAATADVGGKRKGVGAINNSKQQHQRGSKGALPSPHGSAKSFDVQVSEKRERLRVCEIFIK